MVPWQGRDGWIPWAFVGGFCLLLLPAVALSVVAAASDPGLVAGAPHRQAGSYVLPTGPAPVLELRITRRGAAAVEVEARLRGPDGSFAEVEALTGTLQRATHARDDLPVTFAARHDGVWSAWVTAPKGGQWELAVQARGAGGVASGTLRL
ncbi:MAG: hypothetical protein JWO26_3261 [Rhodospirillales bacterium]|jgi:hypothetical protein|nr:hypothetical protein [Rhodospirillales bacterium]